MKDSGPTYVKLPARAFGWAGPARLWLGPDHVLQVTTTSVSERYRRFYLRDIEALIVRRTNLRLVLNLISGSLAGLSAASGAAFWWVSTIATDEIGLILFRIFAGIFWAGGAICLLFLLINTLFGATCACFIQTPAGLDRLAAPSRARSARKLLARLAPLVVAAQESPAEAPAQTPPP